MYYAVLFKITTFVNIDGASVYLNYHIYYYHFLTAQGITFHINICFHVHKLFA